jgi:hypothetical protein
MSEQQDWYIPYVAAVVAYMRAVHSKPSEADRIALRLFNLHLTTAQCYKVGELAREKLEQGT